MKMLEVQLPEQTAAKLEKVAERLSVTPEELLVLSVEEKLAQLDEEFRRSADYVLEKNADLYGRLA
jgi:hypothetical protein